MWGVGRERVMFGLFGGWGGEDVIMKLVELGWFGMLGQWFL